MNLLATILSCMIHISIAFLLYASLFKPPLGALSASLSNGGKEGNFENLALIELHVSSLSPLVSNSIHAIKAQNSTKPGADAQGVVRASKIASPDLAAEVAGGGAIPPSTTLPTHSLSSTPSLASSLKEPVQQPKSDDGNPDGATKILTQIARCLPPTVRPKFPLAHLRLEIGNGGELRAAPRVELADPLASIADVLAADQIVQAAMQCGPYSGFDDHGASLDLGVDFSFYHVTG